MALWKKVKGYEGLYLVSDEGQIYSLPRKVSNKRGCYVREGQLLKPGLRGNHGLQYEFVILSNGVNSKHESVNRIVATELNLPPLSGAFIGEFYEATVENIQASVVIHEWYGHLQRGWGDANKTHRYCYSAVWNDPLFQKTTEKYQEFIKSQYNYYNRIETNNKKIR